MTLSHMHDCLNYNVIVPRLHKTYAVFRVGVIYSVGRAVLSGTGHPNSLGLILSPCIPRYVSAGIFLSKKRR